MIKILTAEQTRAADAYTIENEPIASIDLMERASAQLYEWIYYNIKPESDIAIFAGTGNNGGDAFALARMLSNGTYGTITVFALSIGTPSPDCQTNIDRATEINSISIITIEKDSPLPELDKFNIIVDGIFGSGLNRSVSGYWGELVKHINSFRKNVIAIDIPSGLFCESNTDNNGSIVKANTTLSFQNPKLAFLFAENSNYVGDFHFLDIKLHSDFINECDSSYFYIEKSDIATLIPQRAKFAHKGTFGHAFLVAGSYQKTGAAVLAAKACLRSGVGLLTVHVPKTGYTIMQTAVPEAMLCIDETEIEYCSNSNLKKYTNVGIGPGIGQKQSMQNAVKKLLDISEKPMVIDADALNIIAINKDLLKLIPSNSILTPHPGEFDRLTQKHNTGYERLASQIDFSKQNNVITVLKGAFTSIAMPNGNVYINTSGNPGMATAGSGDVLTGIILSLLAQGYKPNDAALAGVYIHGLAGDIASEEFGNESLIASDIIDNIGKAFKNINNDDKI